MVTTERLGQFVWISSPTWCGPHPLLITVLILGVTFYLLDAYNRVTLLSGRRLNRRPGHETASHPHATSPFPSSRRCGCPGGAPGLRDRTAPVAVAPPTPRTRHARGKSRGRGTESDDGRPGRRRSHRGLPRLPLGRGRREYRAGFGLHRTVLPEALRDLLRIGLWVTVRHRVAFPLSGPADGLNPTAGSRVNHDRQPRLWPPPAGALPHLLVRRPSSAR